MKAIRALVVLSASLLLLVPIAASAAGPFGGDSALVIFCRNGSSIYDELTGPVGGPFLWTPATRTFQFGPPTHSGQWLLGISGPLDLCLVTVDPIFTLPATAIVMMGSSQ